MNRPSKRTNPPTPDPALPSLISVEGLAEHWRVRPDTVRHWCRTKEIKSVKIGRKILIDVESLPQPKG